MTTEGHIAALERRHRELDRQIAAEMQNTRYDDLMVSALKRKKLEVKDELSKLQGMTGNSGLPRLNPMLWRVTAKAATLFLCPSHDTAATRIVVA